jgi:hypothetical protein
VQLVAVGPDVLDADLLIGVAVGHPALDDATGLVLRSGVELELLGRSIAGLRVAEEDGADGADGGHGRTPGLPRGRRIAGAVANALVMKPGRGMADMLRLETGRSGNVVSISSAPHRSSGESHC